MPEGYEIRGKSVRIYFNYDGELCREPMGPATPDNIEKTRRLAQIIRYELEAGTFDYSRYFPDSPRVHKTRFGHYLDLLLDIKQNQLAYSSYRGDESKSRVHIRPRWGNQQIRDITHIDIQHWVQRDLVQLHNKTIKEIVSIMRQVFDLYSTTIRQDINPTKGLRIRLPDDTDPDPFTLAEIKTIMDTPTNREQELNLMQFMLWDGPRLSEALALSWEDVLDLDAGIIRYQRAQVRNRYKVTKTKRSTRSHQLLKPAREALIRQYNLSAMENPIDIDVTDRDNKTIRKQTIRPVFLNSQSLKPHYGDLAIRDRFWRTHLEKAGIRYRAPSQCRHTFISHMLSTGNVPMHWIAEHVGHTSTAMISKHYGKWMRQDGDDVIGKIEERLNF